MLAEMVSNNPNRFEQAIEKAKSLGHSLENDPPFLSTMYRHTCKNCGKAVVGNWDIAYGTAIEKHCTDIK